MQVSKIMGVVAAVLVVLSMLASTTLVYAPREGKLSGHVDDDNDCDVIDLCLVYRALRTNNVTGPFDPDNPEESTRWGFWNENADLCGPYGEPDGFVDLWDLTEVCRAYGYYP